MRTSRCAKRRRPNWCAPAGAPCRTCGPRPTTPIPSVPAVHKLLSDREPRVRFEAADALVRSANRGAVPVLIDLLADGPMPLAWRAQETLYRLANEQSPAGLTRETERGKVRDDWAAWWKE